MPSGRRPTAWMITSVALISAVLPVLDLIREPQRAWGGTAGVESNVVVVPAREGASSTPGATRSGIGPGWSAVVKIPRSDSVLLSLVGASGPPLGVRLRSHGSNEWSRWVDVHASRDEAPDTGEEGVRSVDLIGPIWTGASTDRLEVMVEQGSGSALRVEALRTSSAGYSTPTAAFALTSSGPTQPQIMSTAAWGSPGWSYATEGCESGPRVAALQLALVHHTVTTNSYSSAETDDLIRGIYYAHRARGWCDIAYNFIVDRFGRIWQGRSGPANAAVIGGHAAGFNSGSVGVALLGQHHPSADPPAVAPTSAQLDALATVIAWKFTLHGLDPSSSTSYTARAGSSRYPEGTVVPLKRISGHRDVGSTSCPGDYSYAVLGDVRSRASARWSVPTGFAYGASSDSVLWGDWNGDGRADPAVRRGNQYLMRFSASGGNAELTMTFGRTTDQAIVGDWDGNGTDTIGVYRDGQAYLTSDSLAYGIATSSFRYGTAGDLAISGDWDGDGRDGIGVRRGNEWLLRQTASGGNAQVSFHFGRWADGAFVGDWDGDGRDTAGVWRDGVGYLASGHSSAAPVALQDVPGTASRVIAGDPTGRGFDMVGRAEGNRWTPWLLMPRTP